MTFILGLTTRGRASSFAKLRLARLGSMASEYVGGMGKPELVSVSSLLGQIIFLMILF